MHDIFVSYAHENEIIAASVSDFLSAQGLDVWRDVNIGADATLPFEEKISLALQKSSLVVVIWTKEAIKSVWVKAEARRALRDGKLIQIAYGVGEYDLPLPFGEYQFADLSDWDCEGEHEKLIDVILTIDKTCPIIGSEEEEAAEELTNAPIDPVNEEAIPPPAMCKGLQSCPPSLSPPVKAKLLSKRKSGGPDTNYLLSLPATGPAREEQVRKLKRSAQDDGDAFDIDETLSAGGGTQPNNAPWRPPKLRLPKNQNWLKRLLRDAKETVDRSRRR